MPDSKAAFLADTEPLTHNDRARRVVELGARAAKGDADARRTIADLHASPEAYDRLLALLSVFGSRDGSLILDALTDVSRTIRRKATRMVALFCDDTQAELALGAIIEKRVLYRTISSLARRKRLGPIDAFVKARMKKGREAVIVDVIAYGSEALLKGFMSDFVEGGGFIAWARVCARHPSFAAAWFLADVKRGSSLDPRQRYRLYGELTSLAKRAPDATLALIKALFDIGEEPYQFRDPLGVLVRRRPRETFDLVKARHESGRPAHPPGAFGVVRFDKVVHKLGPERLDYIVRHAWSTLRDGKYGVRWFLRLSESDQRAVLKAFIQGGRGSWGAFLFRYFKADSPEEKVVRERAFDRWSRAAQALDGTIGTSVLDWLPRDLREREAKRHLEKCPALASKPDQRNAYAGLLPFAEAKAALAPFLGHPEGEERAKAQAILISSVRHDHAAMSDAIANVKARKFEQDPVRKAMFDALLALRVALYRAEHLDAIGAIVQDALDAADLSHGTASSVERLVVRLFRIDGVWGGRFIAKLLAVRGSVSTWGMGDGLTNADAERLSPALAALAATWTTQERAGAVISLAQSLGIRLRVVTPVLEALEKLSRELPFASVSAAALDIINLRDRKRFTRLAPELLREDESFVLIPTVARYVSLRRQDLLTERLLSALPMKGRFATGRTSWVIDFGVGYSRWTANQQRTYAKGLISILKDESRDVPTLRFAISTLVRLAHADASSILPFAADPRPPLREMAIRGLPWLDARQGVPVLIEALGDDRARWAIYALRKVFSELRRDQVLAELRAVPTTKVTVAKEVVRLLGELGGEDAYNELLRLDKPETHRDVRIALLRALWDHLERPQTWVIFEKAVRDPDWIVGSKLADVPLGRLSSESEERVVVLLSTILGRTEPEARLDLLKRAASIPLRDASRSLFKRLLAHMGVASTDEAALAFTAALSRMNPSEVSAVAGRFKEMVPSGRHVGPLLTALMARLGPYASSTHTSVAKEALGALLANSRTTPQYISLGARLWGWKDLAGALIELSKKDLLYYDAMETALAAVRACVHPESLEDSLRKQSDARLRRLALAALVSAAAPQNGWGRERRERLVEYQNDKNPGVSGPAHFVFPP